MSCTWAWNSASEPPLPLSAGAAGTSGTRTVTRTFASVVPPSFLATRWKLVELDGETVCVPLTGTSPMPSMLTLVALDERQLRTTDWPRSMAMGSAVMEAVGAGTDDSGAIAAGGGAACFLWQPGEAITARGATGAPLVQRDGRSNNTTC